MLDITNTKPTARKADELRGRTIPIGEYLLTIDEIKAGKLPDTWQGRGHVLWEPMGTKVHVCVRFDTLRINTDDVVYGGVCYSYSDQESLSDIQVVDKLFSDWGIDNIIGETGIPYADELQSSVSGKVRDIAKRVNLSKYYDYVKRGQAIYDDFLKGEVQNLYMPMALPKSVNKSPVDIQISSMKFTATYATMDLIGEFTLPNSNNLANDILVFGAPRLCISPERVLPESGTVALLSNFTIKDPKSGYEMTFKAPENVTAPENGCYISWHADALELLGVDIDMRIPKLVKDNNGSPTKEQPVLNVRASIGDWDDWLVDDVTIDPFQVEDLPGWTFTASDIVYDHSAYRNSSSMGKFPTGYNKTKAGISGTVGRLLSMSYDDKTWQGLFIKEIGVKFPKALEFGTSGDKRLAIAANNMFFDKSGATLSVTAGNIISAKTGKAGGWEFSLDKVYLSFIQNGFNDCGFSGKFGVPLLDGTIDYDCKIKKMTSNSSNAGQYAYIFKTQQINNLSLDFILADATFNKDQTYFLLESIPTSSGQDTSCELVMGGDVTIGGAAYLNKVLKQKLKLNIEIPGVHFCGMRISNKKSWTSTYESAMQSTAKNVSLKGKTFYTSNDLQLGSCYINFGKWSLASDQKKLGGFDLSLNKYEFSLVGGQDVKLYMQGQVTLVSGIALSASAGINIYATASKPSSLSDLKDISLKYKETTFNDLGIDASFAGMTLKGSLSAGDDSSKEGYKGTLNFKMPGDLFSVDASGGYFKTGTGERMYTYGWFYIAVGSKSGIDAPPIKINSISGGFYYNCKKNGESATPQKGLIGVIAGLKLSTTAGEEALNASLDMTVVYDSKKNGLSTFIFNGKVKALSELVSADCNLVYEHDNQTKYLQLDITVDASADSEKLTNALTGTNSTFGDMKTQLNSSYQKLQTLEPKGSLEKMADERGTPDARKSKENGSNLSVGCGSTISLQLKITWKENGSTYAKPHWHIYLGEPEISKRCTYTWLKFKSSIVSVNIGANGYVCIGNELPNNGQLPDIPEEVSKYLNGSNNGKGIESASLSEADRARQSSLKEFQDQITSIGGGVMFGAQVYGYLNVDLGIFYLYAGATAGFDISLIKLPDNFDCTNFSGAPGHKGWYGYGQLYAYLYAKFGINLDLGFWSKQFDVCDAGIGGLFQMQGPKPTHFEGKARVKLKLLGGLVNVDRRFSFECGDGCDLFYGNALDEFKLFGDLSCGYDNQKQGWSDNNKISPKFIQRPYFTTEAPLDETFRVLDETEKARLAKNYSGDKSNLDMEASRTFIFRSNVGEYVTLEEYVPFKSRGIDQYRLVDTHQFAIKGQNRYNNYLDIMELNPNSYYKMTVTGYAKEIQKGQEVNPLKYNEAKKKYENVAWSQTKTYYFCTGPAETLPDCPENFQDLIAIAYPSYYNKVVSPTATVTAHIYDVQHPNLAFYSDVSKSILQKGTLNWVLYNLKGREATTVADKQKAVWSTWTGYSCNLIAQSPLKAEAGNFYKLTLEYSLSSFNYKTFKTTVSTTKLVDLIVLALPTDWKTGIIGVNNGYDAPFIGTRIESIKYKYDSAPVSDYDISYKSKINGRYCMVADPYWYISYLSNYAFFGGWNFAQERLDNDVTTAQSLIYSDKGGVYEGRLGTGSDTYNTYNGVKKIRDLSVYSYSQYGKFTDYPLPELDGTQYNYTLTGLSRVPVYTPGEKNPRRVSGYIKDFYSPALACDSLSDKIHEVLKILDGVNADNRDNSASKRLNAFATWYAQYRGQYVSAVCNDVRLQIPYYQFPIFLGSCFENKDTYKKVTAWSALPGYKSADQGNAHSRGHDKHSEYIHSTIYGRENYQLTKDGLFNKNNKNLSYRVQYNGYTDYITQAQFSIYRCNVYNYNKCSYGVDYIYRDEPCFETFTISSPLYYYDNYDH